MEIGLLLLLRRNTESGEHLAVRLHTSRMFVWLWFRLMLMRRTNTEKWPKYICPPPFSREINDYSFLKKPQQRP